MKYFVRISFQCIQMCRERVELCFFHFQIMHKNMYADFIQSDVEWQYLATAWIWVFVYSCKTRDMRVPSNDNKMWRWKTKKECKHGKCTQNWNGSVPVDLKKGNEKFKGDNIYCNICLRSDASLFRKMVCKHTVNRRRTLKTDGWSSPISSMECVRVCCPE